MHIKNPDEEAALYQTELETEAAGPPEIEDDGSADETSPVSQTETVEEPEGGEFIASASEEPNPGAISQTDSTESANLPSHRRRRPFSPPTVNVISIDDRPTVETEADKARNDLLDLMESFKTGRILTGTIQGVERQDDRGQSMAVLYHGDFKIIIPAKEAVEPPADFRGRDPDDVMHYLLTKRMGAEVDYIVKGMDAETGIAVGSRLEAMGAKRREYYFGTDRDGNNLLYSGVCAEARVISVIRAGIFVDLFGLEVYIPLRELSYQRLLDAAGSYQPGQRILIKILELDRSDRTQLRVTASVKQAGDNPYAKALRKYTVGNRYVGTVSMVDTNGVFVSLGGGVDCLCSYPKRGRPPRGARVTVRVLGVNHETNRIWGVITHFAAAH